MNNKVITGEVRLSYAHLFERQRKQDGSEGKYGVSLLIPKSDKATLKKIKEAIEAAKEEGKSKWNGKIPVNLKLPLRDGDEERPDDPAYAGCYFVNANCERKPQVVRKSGGKVIPITDSEEVYSGCYAFASIDFYPFDAQGNRGVACGLNSVLKRRDGDPLGSASNVDEDFADAEDTADEDYEDIL